MWNKFKTLFLATALLLSFSIVIPLAASADGNFNATIQPGEKVKLAEEPIWLGTTVTGTQSPVYSTGNCGVQYIVQNNNGTIIGQQTNYNYNFSFNIDTKALGETLSLWGKNVYTGAKDVVKTIGKWLD